MLPPHTASVQGTLCKHVLYEANVYTRHMPSLNQIIAMNCVLECICGFVVGIISCIHNDLQSMIILRTSLATVSQGFCYCSRLAGTLFVHVFQVYGFPLFIGNHDLCHSTLLMVCIMLFA